MKIILPILICSFIANSAIADLTQQDLEEIRKIVDERVTESEKRMKEYTDKKFSDFERRTDLKFERVYSETNGIKWFIGFVSLFVIGEIALIIYTLTHTSKEVDKVKEYRNRVVDVVSETSRIVGETGVILENAKTTLENLIQTIEDSQRAIKTRLTED